MFNENTTRVARIYAGDLSDQDRLVDGNGDRIGTVEGTPDMRDGDMIFTIRTDSGDKIKAMQPERTVRIEIERTP